MNFPTIPSGMRIRRGAYSEAMLLSGIDNRAGLNERFRALEKAAAARGMTTQEYVVDVVPKPLERQPTVCPRCHGGIPADHKVGAHPGAMSRATPERDIEVCSRCGEQEAFRLVPVADWPVIPQAENAAIRLLVNPIHEPSHDEREL